MTATCTPDDEGAASQAPAPRRHAPGCPAMKKRALRLEALLAVRAAAEHDVLWLADMATDTFFEPAAAPGLESIMVRLRHNIIRAKEARRNYENAIDSM